MRLVEKHSLPTRIFHWVNVVALSVMTWSGLMIYWAQDPYQIQIGGRVLFTFFPDWFFTNRLWSLDHRLALGMAWHFSFAWLFGVNGLLYVAHLVYSGEWRDLVPTPKHVRQALHVVFHDLGLTRTPLPPGKFNAAQRFAYTGVVLMGAGSVVTGLAIYKPIQLSWLTNLLGGYQYARWEHFTLTILFFLFLCVHLAQVAKAGWNNFRSMVIGVEVAEEASHG
ncbi:MAG: cytochrome b/b6 domain-containing protein [Planctomycetia bacterium]